MDTLDYLTLLEFNGQYFYIFIKSNDFLYFINYNSFFHSIN